jgi:hypothetical protein
MTTGTQTLISEILEQAPGHTALTPYATLHAAGETEQLHADITAQTAQNPNFVLSLLSSILWYERAQDAYKMRTMLDKVAKARGTSLDTLKLMT